MSVTRRLHEEIAALNLRIRELEGELERLRAICALCKNEPTRTPSTDVTTPIKVGSGRPGAEVTPDG